MPRQAYICITGPYVDQQSLANGYFTPGTLVTPSSEVRNDRVVAYSIEPVTQQPQNGKSLYLPDYLDTDVFSVGLGNPDTPPTGGTFDITVGGTPVNGIAYNITAAALQTAINAVTSSDCVIVLLEEGVYKITGIANGAISTGFLSVTNDADLFPLSTARFSEGSLGSATSRYQLLLVLNQSSFCYSEPDTELPEADVELLDILAGSGTSNHIQLINFTVANTYAGSFALSATADGVTATCGIVRPGMDATEVGLILKNHENIKFAEQDGTPSNVQIEVASNGWTVSFIGTLGNSSANTLLVENSTNDPLIGPQGKSGTINYNTFGLLEYSEDQPGDTFQLTLQIRRTRASGEDSTLLVMPQTIHKDVLNAASAVPTPLPSYYTTTESNARFVKMVPGTSTMQSGSKQSFGSGSELEMLSGAVIDIQSGVTGVVPVANGGTARTTKFPYLRLGPASGAFAVTAFNSFAYELLTGMVAATGLTGAWASDAFTCPETGLLLVGICVPSDQFTTGGDIAVFKNGSNAGRLRSIQFGMCAAMLSLPVTAADVLDFRVSSNVAAGNIYVNDAGTSAYFGYQNNF